MTDAFASLFPEAVAPAYRVLARKYRPKRFAEVVGQDVMVRTLTNAISSGRLAHAYLLTGVRGVGKTTTARLLARALNCTGPDGQGRPSAEPCGVCDNCRAIADDRHVDVLEMNAADHTGVAGIRDLIDGVRYRPVAAPFKVYILDEVHMLSTSSFNALLKTLEEPPPHVKFIFGTTEVHRLPLTVLSRCQRFDLKRVDAETMQAHLADIAGREQADVDDEALALLARAADGSIRDGLSLLDQAIAHSAQAGGAESGSATAAMVRDMLGLADRARSRDLFDALMAGGYKEALAIFDELYRNGADPAQLIGELLEVTHGVTRAKATGAAPGHTDSALEALAASLPMAALSQAWQILLKGAAEVQTAPDPRMAAEMVLLRLGYAAQLPSPEELLRELKEGGGDAPAPARAAPAPARRPEPPVRAVENESASDTAKETVASYDDVLDMLARRREAVLRSQLTQSAHLVKFEPGAITLRLAAGAPSDLTNRLSRALHGATGARWMISLSSEAGQATVAEQRRLAQADDRKRIEAHPLVKAALASFPGAAIAEVRRRGAAPTPEDSVPPWVNEAAAPEE